MLTNTARMNTQSSMKRMTSRLGRLAAVFCLAAGMLGAQTVKGPDSFGYTATNGAVSSFQDISNTGVRVLQNSEDDTLTIAIGFPFRFYQQSGGYETACVNVNGLVTFNGCEDGADSFANRNLTQGATPTDLPTIAAYWSDLTFNDPNADAVYYQTIGTAGDRQFIIQWNKVYDDAGRPMTFQVMLAERTGEIQIRYLDFDASPAGTLFGDNAVVGIRAAQGQTNGKVLQWSDNVSILSPGQVLRFAYANAAVCPLQLSKTSVSQGAGSESGSLGVTVGAGCPWTATTQTDWITLTSGLTGSGNGTVTYAVNANPMFTARQGTIRVGDQTLTVSQAATPRRLVLSASSLSLQFQQGSGTTTLERQVSLAADVGALSFTVATVSDGNFLTAAANTASTPATLTVTANAAGRAPGTYNGTITISAPDAVNTQETIAVTLTVTAAPPPPPPPGPPPTQPETSRLVLSTETLRFQVRQGSAVLSDQTTVTIGASSGAIATTLVVDSTPEFLSVSASRPVTPVALTVKVDAKGLQPGTYTGTISVAGYAAFNSPRIITVTLVVLPPPKLAVSAQTVALQVRQGAGALTAQEKVTLTSESVAMPFTTAVSSDQNFLSVAGTASTTPATLTLAADATRLAPGTYKGTVVVTAPGTSGSPRTIAVTLAVLPPLLAASADSLTIEAGQTDHYMALSRKVEITSATPVDISVSAAANGIQKFLSAELTGTSTPSFVRIGIDVTKLPAGSYTGTVTITAASGQGTLNIPVTLNVVAPRTGRPSISDDGLTNGASFAGGPVAPGSIATIWGINLAGDPLGSSGSLATSLGGVTVTVNGVPAPLFYVSPGQLNFQVPYETTAPGTAAVVVARNGVASESFALKVEPARPGIFLLPGSRAAALNQDYSLNTPEMPVAPGKVICIYLTGLGEMDSPIGSGVLAPSDRLIRAVGKVEATIGGKPAEVQFAGLAPGFAGLMQVNLIVPDLPAQDHPVVISVNGVPSNSALISVGTR